jgi:hypothetical protein
MAPKERSLMKKSIEEIEKLKKNVNRDWLLSEIARRFKKIEDKDTDIKLSQVAAEEIVLIYLFFLSIMEKSGYQVKDIMQNFYIDAQFLIDKKLITSNFYETADYRKSETAREKLSELLPNIPIEEESTRFFFLSNPNMEKLCSEFAKNPKKAKDYVISSISGIPE